ncbi:hypothetical protein [Hazenella coriacea]|uniref:Uncharacterized protein n=1 Tax=Hazenella coriacea TaxID=1179467 RepID=A0A4R3KZS7_9BACL|nr:hypothetical protein [Hazenella coriacea]TCS92220.1 hypothetical protein EDD58_11411 [Hazenella coriacea]
MSWFNVRGDDWDSMESLGKVVLLPLDMAKSLGGFVADELHATVTPKERKMDLLNGKCKDLEERQEKNFQKRQEIKNKILEKRIAVEDKVATWILDRLNGEGFNDFMVKREDEATKIVRESKQAVKDFNEKIKGIDKKREKPLLYLVQDRESQPGKTRAKDQERTR